MPLNNIPQPEIIVINDSLRLRKYDGNLKEFLAGYQDPYVYQNSEGIFDEDKKSNHRECMKSWDSGVSVKMKRIDSYELDLCALD